MFYTHAALDRADRLRRDEAALSRLLTSDRARILPVHRGDVLVGQRHEEAPPRLAWLSEPPADATGSPIWLGFSEPHAFFAIDTSPSVDVDAITTAARLSDGTGLTTARFVDLRRAGPIMSADESALLAYARGLVYWQSTVRHCTRCGESLEDTEGGHVKRCRNEACRHSEFPRTDPAVIMLVKDAKSDPERCLLGRSPAWPDGVFSTLAGFVEVGESLEQAVAREVAEESAIRIDDVRYVASQPWPFPRSLMLGFEATALSRDIEIDPIELADARWFTRDELADFGNWGDARYALQLPRPDSIARFLIDRWLGSVG